MTEPSLDQEEEEAEEKPLFLTKYLYLVESLT
jgi:hypothetical protein